MESVKKFYKINEEFKKLADLLFFTERNDIDLVSFKKLLKSNYSCHFRYLCDRFDCSSKIFWDHSYWNNRFSFLLSLKDRRVSQFLERKILKNLKHLIKFKKKINIKHDTAMLQFLEFCKIKSQYSKNILIIRNFLSDLIFYANPAKIANIIKLIIPHIFSSFTDYFCFISKYNKHCLKTLNLFLNFKYLEKEGIVLDKQPIFNMIKEVILSQNLLSKLHRAKVFTYSLSDKYCFSEIKKIYNENLKNKILSLIKELDVSTFLVNHCFNTKNMLELDSSLEEEIISAFLKNLFFKSSFHKNSFVDKIINLIKWVPKISVKKILFWLSSNKKKYEAQFILKKFPHLDKLAAFI